MFNTLLTTEKKNESSIRLLLCERNPLVISGFPQQAARNVGNFSLSWRYGAGQRKAVYNRVNSTKQLLEQFFLSVCLSVCPSVCHIFFIMFPSSYHPEIFRSYYHWPTWCPCKRSRSKVKVTEVMTPFSGFWTVTPVWIHIWWWNFAQSLMLLRRCALLFFKVIPQISRSHGFKNRWIWPKLGVSGL